MKSSTSRQHVVVVVLSCLIVVAAVIAASHVVGEPSPVPSVWAACTTLPNCGLGDRTLASVLDVDHANEAWTRQVEPNTTDTWTVTAYYSWVWNSGQCHCLTAASSSATAAVTWTDDAGWSVVCTGCSSSGPIYGLYVYNIGSCGGQSDLSNGFTYRLLADVDRSLGNLQCPITEQWNLTGLEKVAYTTTSVDNGNLVDSSAHPCTEGSPVSPTSQTWTPTDSSDFECGIDSSYTGTSVTILYR